MQFCRRFSPFILLFFLVPTCLGFFRENEAKEKAPKPQTKSWETIVSKVQKDKLDFFAERSPKQIQAILLHSSDNKKLSEYLQLTIDNGFMIHAFVSQAGEIYFDPKFLSKTFIAAPGMDAESIHITYEGTQESLLKNEIQKSRLISFIRSLTTEFKIPLSNYDIQSKKGIFTHNHSKRRYGGFATFSPCGGEKALSFILQELGGKFFEEESWKNRYESGWVLKKENRAKIQESFKPTNGRGISKAEKSPLKHIEKETDGTPLESYRVQYTYRGKIKPTCVVLHFTAIPDYMESLRILESRNLTATLMVDRDGKGYQLLDTLEDKASAAFGTNEQCIQIEIVAKDTQELLRQKEQIETVKKLVIELSKLYNFTLQNEDITALSGVYSHTQAKKKWGGSIFLNAKDFDPGEEYMNLILNEVGGTYFPEDKWKNRLDWNWAILFKEFQP